MGWFDQERLHWVDLDLVRAMSTHASVSPDIDYEVVSDDELSVRLTIPGFFLKSYDNLDAYSLKAQGGSDLLQVGAPDLVRHVTSVVLPEGASLALNIEQQASVEYTGIEILPSKGNVTRDVALTDVDYYYDPAIYEQDAFYPQQVVEVSAPYQLGDQWGQDIIFNPYQYNPVSTQLRISQLIDLDVHWVGGKSQRDDVVQAATDVMDAVYANHFANYTQRDDVEQGKMLVVIADGFYENSTTIAAISAFVSWKNEKGIETHYVKYSDVAQDADGLRDYINQQYTSDGLDYVLLMGSHYNSAGSLAFYIPSIIRNGAASDTSYGYLSGTDSYPEVSVGRFSAVDAQSLMTQIQRSLEYERNPTVSSIEWYTQALGIASNQGPGFASLADDQFHEEVLSPILLANTFDQVASVYDPSGTDAAAIDVINQGVSVINYTGHGYETGWANGASLNNQQINTLTNAGQLPFVISVACVVGSFDVAQPFSLSWLQAINSFDKPVGAIAHLGSTINQSWVPPMFGQYAMNAILTDCSDSELFQGSVETVCNPQEGTDLVPASTLGAITRFGYTFMNSHVSGGSTETDHWTLFGDPSLMLRTSEPVPVEIGLPKEMRMVADQWEFSTSIDYKESWLTLSKLNDEGVSQMISSAQVDASGLVKLDVDNEIEIDADYRLTLSNPLFSKNFIPWQKDYTAMPYDVGDVNGDGVLSILDIINLQHTVLASDYSLAGDVNADGGIDVLDIVSIIRGILVREQDEISRPLVSMVLLQEQETFNGSASVMHNEEASVVNEVAFDTLSLLSWLSIADDGGNID